MILSHRLGLPSLLSVLLVCAGCNDDGGGGGAGGNGGDSSDGGDDDNDTDSGGGGAGGDGSGEDPDSMPDPDEPTFGEGPYSLVYAGQPFGFDSRTATTTFEGDALLTYDASADEALERGEAEAVDVATVVVGDAAAAIGRWAGGQLGGTYYSTSPLPTYGDDNGFHYGVGEGLATLPADGEVTYTLRASTDPTFGDGSSAAGSVTASAAAIFDGESTKIAVALSVTMPSDVSYDSETTGGVADPSQSEFGSFFNGFVNNSNFGDGSLVTGAGGKACAGTECNVNYRGFFVGDDGEIFVVVYVISSQGVTIEDSIHGVLAFGKAD